MHNAIGRILSKEPTYAHCSQSLILHMPVPPREYAPSLFHSPSATPIPFQGLGNRLDQELSELYSWCWILSRRKSLPNKLSHLGEFLIGLTTYLFIHGPDNPLLQLFSTQFLQRKENNHWSIQLRKTEGSKPHSVQELCVHNCQQL